MFMYIFSSFWSEAKKRMLLDVPVILTRLPRPSPSWPPKTPVSPPESHSPWTEEGMPCAPDKRNLKIFPSS